VVSEQTRLFALVMGCSVLGSLEGVVPLYVYEKNRLRRALPNISLTGGECKSFKTIWHLHLSAIRVLEPLNCRKCKLELKPCRKCRLENGTELQLGLLAEPLPYH
jgi:hypothetical protein